MSPIFVTSKINLKNLMSKLDIVDFIWTFGVRTKSRLIYTFHKVTKIFVSQVNQDRITLLPHEGLGDLIAILPALMELESRGVDITIVADKSKWTQIENAFADVPKVNVLHFISNGSYAIPNFLSNLSGPPLIALGHYSNFPIVDYPTSFFWQIGVDCDVAANYLKPKLCKVNFNLPQSYVFIDLNTSKGPLSSECFPSFMNSVTCISNTELLVNESGFERRLFLDADASFHQKIGIALNAEKIICSDAGLFNALIRFEKRPELNVHTRKHHHTHFAGIYGVCKFDGGIYTFTSRS